MATIKVNAGNFGSPTSAFTQLTSNTDVSCATGVSDSTGLFQIQVKPPRTFPLTTIKPANLDNAGPFQMTINPSTNGDITLNPNGTGAVVVTTDLNMSNTSSASVGVINWGNQRFLHNYGEANNNNLFLGRNAGNFSIVTPAGSPNVGIGDVSLFSLTTGTANVACGPSTLQSATTASGNTAVGYIALTSCVSGNDNTSIGIQSLQQLNSGTFNSAIGYQAGFNYTTNEDSNVCIANKGTTGDAHAIRIGTNGSGSNQQDKCFIAGIQGSTVTGSGFPVIIDSTGKLGSTAVGSSGQVLTSNGAGFSPTFQTLTVGASTFHTGSGDATVSGGAITIAGTANHISTSGSGATVTIDIPSSPSLAGTVTAATGFTATAGDITATSGNLVITAATTSTVGQITQAGNRVFHTFGSGCTFLGVTAGNLTNSSNQNTGVGFNALNALNATGENNVAVGYQCGPAITTGDQNCLMGSVAGQAITTGGNNVAIGFQSGQNIVSTSDNTGCGTNSIHATTGSKNTGVGSSALVNLGSGSECTGVGYNAGQQYTTTEANNLCLGANVTGTTGESNVVRIGASITKFFTSGIRGITTVNADAIAVLVDSAGQLGTVSSSIRFKENVKDLNDVSSAVMKLRPVAFNYKAHDAKSIQYGLIAEEVEKVMPRLVIYDDGQPSSVKYHDLPVLLLNEIQKLNKKIEQLEKKLCSK